MTYFTACPSRAVVSPCLANWFLYRVPDLRGFVEARRHPRYPVTVHVTFWGATASGAGRMINLSAGGCEIESEAAPPPGQNLRIYTVMPRRHASVVIDFAPVRWRQGRRFGVEFVKVQPASEEILHHWLARLADEGQ